MKEELETVTGLYQMAIEYLVTYSFQLLAALIILLVGWFIAAKVANAVQALCEKRNIDVTLSRFIASTVKTILIVMVGIVALGKLGISVTPFVAAIGALTFGLSLAAQGLVANYGAGINIIIGRPFVVGDTISVCGVTGQVTEVRLGLTRLVNEDRVTITIPNKHIIGEILHNSNEATLVEASVGVAYDADIDKAIEAIKEAIVSTEGVPEDATPTIGIEAFADSSINIGYRYKVETNRFYQTTYAVNLAILRALNNVGVAIPFPQREIKILNGSVLNNSAPNNPV
ncbi:mechanosensitive ion channel family protein [Saccharophagus degradans]|uniref:mechanosensitive ion channel family protein n=1 Tax=Saccharophagus degradans TaxID=86304 RepID=UPI001C089237|nr:mechanosensitive ion channel family protein [Saccharophagus degradans]MBU2986918.1 mechanosensitive ion channel family protein [Saccharophagus degradans]